VVSAELKQYVAAQAGDYQILGGIGGSLLSPDQQDGIMKTDIVDGAPQSSEMLKMNELIIY
jgi:hypothetical protein